MGQTKTSLEQETPSKKLILVVEGDPSLRIPLGYLLQENGYEVVFAGTGASALQKVKDHPPHLILLETILPDRSGFEICRTLRSKREYRETKIVFLSVNDGKEEFEKGTFVGADACIVKPFAMTHLIDTIQNLLAIK
ncbi:MAG: response regulator [SAR324 cluster bacterium]|nr:response regulator [SAR324 cluster bacterium]